MVSARSPTTGRVWVGRARLVRGTSTSRSPAVAVTSTWTGSAASTWRTPATWICPLSRAVTFVRTPLVPVAVVVVSLGAASSPVHAAAVTASVSATVRAAALRRLS